MGKNYVLWRKSHNVKNKVKILLENIQNITRKSQNILRIKSIVRKSLTLIFLIEYVASAVKCYINIRILYVNMTRVLTPVVLQTPDPLWRFSSITTVQLSQYEPVGCDAGVPSAGKQRRTSVCFWKRRMNLQGCCDAFRVALGPRLAAPVQIYRNAVNHSDRKWKWSRPAAVSLKPRLPH